jgi:outer membrane protein TolC
MKGVLFLCVATGIIVSASPLSEEKTKLLEIKQQKLLADTKLLKYSWISPLNLSLAWQRGSSSYTNESTSTKALIQMNQDIFRSGGIWYSINYAQAFYEAEKLGIDIQEADQLKQLYTLKVQIEKNNLKVRQDRLKLHNREIDIQIIKENYQAGDADISQLNNAAIDSDNAKTVLIVTTNALRNSEFELKKFIGSKSIDALEIPDIPLVDKEFYISNNLELLKYDSEIKAYLDSYKMARSEYLPTLSVNANYGYNKNDTAYQEYDGTSYSYGVRLSMPLDINIKNDLESNQLRYMQTKVSQLDRKLELEYRYDQSYQNIQDYKEKIKVAHRMLDMYKELYDFTVTQVDAGMKTDLDLESLDSSIKIQKLEEEIQNKNIFLEKIALFFDLKHH